MGVSLFDMFFDNDIAQRGDINAASREAEIARFQGEAALQSVDALRRQVIAQRTQLDEMGVLVSVLVKMLADTGALDEKVLRYRVESQVEELREAARPENRMVRCGQCGIQVAATQTQLMAEGTFCDRCAALR